MCKYCNRFFNETDYIYRDDFCIISGTKSGIECIFRSCMTPTTIQANWLMTQVKIIAGKYWGREWAVRYAKNDHYRLEAYPFSNARLRNHEHINEIKGKRRAI